MAADEKTNSKNHGSRVPKSPVNMDRNKYERTFEKEYSKQQKKTPLKDSIDMYATKKGKEFVSKVTKSTEEKVGYTHKELTAREKANSDARGTGAKLKAYNDRRKKVESYTKNPLKKK